ncbi:hypothetical protein DEA8626_03853 [Defluviimonas aquaemixtae]|uniref:Zinc transporter ZupT n=1 Tax=Albidovulum aquaemixtae TaxID=1542388 RepID=A0A2R8BMZ6_9RHOB|nr:divalent cation transporter [Defluviimonas aquaemixtae]SPH24820.1 hypothetical protein DEA8626_03853 [Defluviimonas aquaemixtae]
MSDASASQLLALALATLAGATIPLGAFLAEHTSIRPRWLDEEFRHSAIAFGGGALFSAIALVLVPEGAARLPAIWTLILFALGGVVFYGVDRLLRSLGGQMAQFLAMMLDFVPEAAALGALLVEDVGAGYVLAALIALQNLPESFNACREIRAAFDVTGRRVVLLFAALVPIGPLAAWTGFAVLGDLPEILGGIMIFASGGILYLIFEDIAPAAVLKNRGAPALGAVAGFLLGLAGHLLVQ